VKRTPVFPTIRGSGVNTNCRQGRPK